MLVQCASHWRGVEFVGVCDECAACRVKKDSSRSEQLVVYFYSKPPLGVAYCLAKPKLAQLTRIPNMQTDTQTD